MLSFPILYSSFLHFWCQNFISVQDPTLLRREQWCILQRLRVLSSVFCWKDKTAKWNIIREVLSVLAMFNVHRFLYSLKHPKAFWTGFILKENLRFNKYFHIHILSFFYAWTSNKALYIQSICRYLIQNVSTSLHMHAHTWTQWARKIFNYVIHTWTKNSSSTSQKHSHEFKSVFVSVLILKRWT